MVTLVCGTRSVGKVEHIVQGSFAERVNGCCWHTHLLSSCPFSVPHALPYLIARSKWQCTQNVYCSPRGRCSLTKAVGWFAEIAIPPCCGAGAASKPTEHTSRESKLRPRVRRGVLPKSWCLHPAPRRVLLYIRVEAG